MGRISILCGILSSGVPGKDDLFFTKGQPNVVNLLSEMGFYQGDEDYDCACQIFNSAHADSWDANMRQPPLRSSLHIDAVDAVDAVDAANIIMYLPPPTVAWYANLIVAKTDAEDVAIDALMSLSDTRMSSAISV